jgi:hypothetical protein
MLSGGLTHSLNPTNPRRGKPEMRRCPGFCPYYAVRRQGIADARLNRLLQGISATILQRTYPEAGLIGSFSSLISPEPLFNASRGHGRCTEPDLPETRSCGLVACTAANS